MFHFRKSRHQIYFVDPTKWPLSSNGWIENNRNIVLKICNHKSGSEVSHKYLEMLVSLCFKLEQCYSLWHYLPYIHSSLFPSSPLRGGCESPSSAFLQCLLQATKELFPNVPVSQGRGFIIISVKKPCHAIFKIFFHCSLNKYGQESISL